MNFYLFVEDILVRKIITDFCRENAFSYKEYNADDFGELHIVSPALVFIDMQARSYNPYILAEKIITTYVAVEDAVIAITAARYPEVLRKGKNCGLSTFILRSEVTPLLQHLLFQYSPSNTTH